MKKYIKPSMEMSEVRVCQMLAESLAVSDTTVDGSEALVKEGEWNIWSEDED